ncbi:energy-coupling factor transporter transmembrane component T [Clostridium beijerinckii]|uniref:Cobalt/nickel transport system permease protein n=2 Tax=Clostridium beijerinckii TaxID=1520 RepID=A0A1B9BFU6_CLOBE|nr:energy-coupling factor transporter transmembrane component T [Clostridium beijerinckii]AQS06478.1 nickel transport protein NikQ [Clostridium beijerinckii]MBA2885855.1 cobalt/nickel transport system permease protein [Clostridium beijerinckii]MBA2900444.1 cobalt/nickel transport system permease protein [Clostridium beijerinckii]MBA2910414.1 cobalt/nickel transport system permease protein [Clostridium beijerinckii]MBA9013902.1 cobalt/nickel transport system permease protein [Clostridium beijer
MPEWLLKKDNYTPLKDKNSFIDKSILSIFNVLAMFRQQTKIRNSKFGINPLTKLISTLILIIFVSLSRNFHFIVITTVFMLVLINLLSIKEIKYVVKASMAAAIFTFIILLPAIFLGYSNNTLMITLKVLVSVASVSILTCTTQWNELIITLKIFRIPDIFILVLDITIKYIIILGEFSLNMVYALKLRSVGKNNNKSTALSGVVGTMFIKSKEMAEEMYGAMESRGFTGTYKVYTKFKFKLFDYICFIITIIFVLTYFYFDRL